jgi:hypothetical protein
MSPSHFQPSNSCAKILCIKYSVFEILSMVSVSLTGPWLITYYVLLEINSYSNPVSSYFSFDNTGDGTQGLAHARPVLYHWATPLAP